MRGLNSSSGRMLAIAAAMLAVLMSMGLSAQGGGATAGASALGPRGSVVGSVPKAGAYLGPARLSVRVEDVQASAPMTTPTAVRTNTPGPTETTVAEPEMLILQYVQTNHPGWYCQGPFGTPGHRYIRDCYTFQFGTHPARGYVDNYATESGAQTEWQQRRLYAQGAYPIFREFDYSGYPGYEAGNETFPNGHTENYFWGSIWVMGGTSQDDTNFNRGAGPIANAVYEAAAALGYLGSPTPNPSPSATFFVRTPTNSATPTGSPTGNHTPTATPTSLCLGSNPMCTTTPTHTATPCPMGFSDVSTTDYFYEPVRHLFCRGIISGYSDSTFRPYSNATRGQLVKIVILAALWPIYTPP
ncbi:MAG: S-layer homology domain-containing protein, partial [Chloroflexia bacterium]